MARVTRKFLVALGIEAEKVDQVVEAHSADMNEIKEERDTALEAAKGIPDVTKQRDALQKELDDLKAKAPDAAKVQKDFDDYKLQVETEKATAKAGAALRKALLDKGANEAAVDLMVSAHDMKTVEMDGDNLKDVDATVKPFMDKHAGLFGTESSEGVPGGKPPKGAPPPDYSKMSDADYLSMREKELNK